MSSSDEGTVVTGTVTVTDSTLTSAPTIDVDDVRITPEAVTKSGNTWTIYLNFTFTSAMLRGSYTTSHRFVDINGITSSSSVSVKSMTKGGKKYYNSSGTGVSFSDARTANAKMYAGWK